MSSSAGIVKPTMAETADTSLKVAVIPGESHRDIYLTAVPREGETPRVLFEKLAAAVGRFGARPVSLEIFGVPAEEQSSLQEAFGGPAIACPVIWLDEGSAPPKPLYGVQCHAVVGADTTPISLEGRTVGVQYDAGGVRYCRLGGLTVNRELSRREQTAAIFTLMQSGLAQAGMAFRHVFRTWFYNFEMLDWYGEFNEVRTAFFNEQGVFDGLVPASTGIGGHNAAGTALTAGLIAALPCGGAFSVEELPSPLQCPAPSYGSSFSRAVETETQAARRIYVSGTASIAPEGHSVHIGDVHAQIDLTMKVAQAILNSRAMAWGDVTRAIAYFKYREDAPAFTQYCAAHGLEALPVLFTANDICRDDLLFEIELDAAVKKQ